MSDFELIEALREDAQHLTESKDYDGAEQKYGDMICHLAKRLQQLDGEQLEKLFVSFCTFTWIPGATL